MPSEASAVTTARVACPAAEQNCLRPVTLPFSKRSPPSGGSVTQSANRLPRRSVAADGSDHLGPAIAHHQAKRVDMRLNDPANRQIAPAQRREQRQCSGSHARTRADPEAARTWRQGRGQDASSRKRFDVLDWKGRRLVQPFGPPRHGRNERLNAGLKSGGIVHAERTPPPSSSFQSPAAPSVTAPIFSASEGRRLRRDGASHVCRRSRYR